jgi:hypothetical protein
MAGNYPDVPGPRLAYDRDGSIGFVINNANIVTELSSYELQALNDEDNDGAYIPYGGGYLGIIFPELRDIVGYFIAGGNVLGEIQTSPDTTTGLDGTWTTVVPTPVQYNPVSPNYRTNIAAVTWSGIKAIRWAGGEWNHDAIYYAAHFYGSIVSGETPDRLRLWHPTLDQPLDDQAVSPDGAYFDWGNAPQNTSQDRDFRVKNNSASLTANTIVISTEALTPATIPETRIVSKDGVTFGATATITSLAPGAISAVCTLRRDTPSNATLSIWAARIVAQAASWT